MYRFSLLRLILARDADAFFRGWGTPTPKKQNNLLNRISITRRWVTVYCPNTKFTKEPSARYLLIITKISIADYTKILDIGLRLYCTNQRNIYCLSSRGFAKMSSFLVIRSSVAIAASRASVPIRSTVAPRRSLTYPFSLYQSITFSITVGTSSAE